MARAAGTAVALVVLALVAVPGWLPLIVPDPLTYPELPYPVPNKAIRAGEPLVLRIARCNHDGRELAITSTRKLVHPDGVHAGTWVPLPDGSARVPPGCQTETVSLGVIDSRVLPGGYRIEGVATAYGRLRTVNVYWYSEEFEVTP